MIDLTPKSFELTPFSAKVSISDLAEGNVNMGPQSLQGGFDSKKINLLTDVDDKQVIYSSMGELTGHPGLTYVPSTTTNGTLYIQETISSNPWTGVGMTPAIRLTTPNCNGRPSGDIELKTGISENSPQSNYGSGWIWLEPGLAKHKAGGWIWLEAGRSLDSQGGWLWLEAGRGDDDGGWIWQEAADGNKYNGGWIWQMAGNSTDDEGGWIWQMAGDGEKGGGWIWANAGNGKTDSGHVWIMAGNIRNIVGAEGRGGMITLKTGRARGDITDLDYREGRLHLQPSSQTLTANIDDGFTGCLEIGNKSWNYVTSNTYGGAYTVSRYNYINLVNVLVDTATTLTDACVFRFDANAGTHKAVDSGTTKISPWAVDAWTKININGTVHYVPSYVGKESNTTADLTIPDAKNIIFSTGTGTQIGTAATQKLSFYGVTPIVQPNEYTQTYSTADKTIANIAISAITQNSSAVTVTATDSSPWGYSSSAEATAIASQLNNCVTDIGNIKTQIDNTLTDVTDLKQAVNALINDLKELGLVKKP